MLASPDDSGLRSDPPGVAEVLDFHAANQGAVSVCPFEDHAWTHSLLLSRPIQMNIEQLSLFMHPFYWTQLLVQLNRALKVALSGFPGVFDFSDNAVLRHTTVALI
jgi:hypothetical protein